MSSYFPKCVRKIKLKTAPTLHTERLLLRSFTLEDASDVKQLAWNPNVASTIQCIEYPYIEGMAEDEIRRWGKEYIEKNGPNFAVTLRSNGTLIGNVELQIRRHLPYNDAFIGYWIGEPFWNCGFVQKQLKLSSGMGFVNAIWIRYLLTISNEIRHLVVCYRKLECGIGITFRKTRNIGGSGKIKLDIHCLRKNMKNHESHSNTPYR